MNVGTIKEELRAMLKRGSSLDDQLNGFLRRSAQWIEKNHNLSYMKRVVVLNMAGGSDAADLPAEFIIKSVLRVKWPQSVQSRTYDSRQQFAYKIDFADIDHTPSGAAAGYPGQFYMDGSNRLIFNGTVSADTSAQAQIIRYSDWPLAANQTHWLIQRAEGLLLAQAMLEAAVFNRDERAYTMFQSYRQEQITVLLAADAEETFSGQDIFLTV